MCLTEPLAVSLPAGHGNYHNIGVLIWDNGKENGNYQNIGVLLLFILRGILVVSTYRCLTSLQQQKHRLYLS